MVPVVIYNGKGCWNESPKFLDRFGVLQSGTAQFIPEYRYILIDEEWYDDEMLLEKQSALGYFFLIDKTELKDTQQAEKRIIGILRQVHEKDREIFLILVKYITGLLRYRNIEMPGLEEYIEKGRKGPMLAQSLDELIEESIEKGKEQGLEQGTRTGSLLGKKEALLRVMRKKFELSEDEADLILKVDLEYKIDHAIDEILSAEDKEVILNIFR